MNKLLILPFLFFSLIPSIYSSNLDKHLKELDREIKNRKKYMERKELRVDSLKNLYTTTMDLHDEYRLNRKIFDEYATYSFNSAISYVNRNEEIGRKLNDIRYTIDNKLCYAELFATSGLIKESIDMAESIDRSKVAEDQLYDYYNTLSWVYLKAKSFANDSIFAPEYARQGALYVDSAYIYCPPNTIEHTYYEGNILTQDHKIEEAKKIYLDLYSKIGVDTRIYAVITYHLATFYKEENNVEKFEEFLIKSAISDQVCALKENLALQTLAIYLFQNNPEELERAYRYIQISMSDAKFFNNRIRALQIGDKLPIIVTAYQAKSESENYKLKVLLIIISILAIAMSIAILYIYKQIKTLNRRQVELKQLNIQLNELNESLSKANKTKEEYVSIFVDLCSSYIDQLDRHRKMVTRKIKANQIEELVKIVTSSEKVDAVLINFFHTFDKAFLNLYPNFINSFNALLSDEEQITLKEDELLNTELRIFALIRLGISNSSDIAVFLRYSPQTIYNYRTKIRNKAKDRENFEEKIMHIGI